MVKIKNSKLKYKYFSSIRLVYSFGFIRLQFFYIKIFFVFLSAILDPPFLIYNYEFKFVISDSKNPYKMSFVICE